MNATADGTAADILGASGAPLLAVRGMSKAFPGVQALSDVDWELRKGEVHGLAGQNGAGKSTLIKILSGAQRQDEGSIEIDGEQVDFHSPSDAQAAGIFTIYQELSLVPQLTVAENILLADLPKARFGAVSWSDMRAKAKEALDWLGFKVDVNAKAGSLPVAEQQGVELAKALHRSARVVLLDEPAATLPTQDVKRLLAVLKSLQERGVSLIYISHRFEEVFEICSRITVLRDGKKVTTVDRADTSPTEIVRAMIGRQLRTSMMGESLLAEDSHDRPRLSAGGDPNDVALSVQGLSDGSAIHDVSFEVGRREVVGIAGLIGSGQAELASCLFGDRKTTEGTISVDGRAVNPKNAIAAIRAGIGLLPEERKTQGLVLGMSVGQNITLANLRDFSRSSIIDSRKERRAGQQMREALEMKVHSLEQPAVTLSGGNQQKIVLAKWLVSRAKVLVFHEPTRGVDVGAKEEIYDLIRTFVEQGGSAVLMSAELSETMMCDRILVLARGRIVGQFEHDEVDAHGDAILSLCH
jgi:ABC-type sugar transport system ATPase subunit